MELIGQKGPLDALKDVSVCDKDFSNKFHII